MSQTFQYEVCLPLATDTLHTVDDFIDGILTLKSDIRFYPSLISKLITDSDYNPIK